MLLVRRSVASMERSVNVAEVGFCIVLCSSNSLKFTPSKIQSVMVRWAILECFALSDFVAEICLQ